MQAHGALGLAAEQCRERCSDWAALPLWRRPAGEGSSQRPLGALLGCPWTACPLLLSPLGACLPSPTSASGPCTECQQVTLPHHLHFIYPVLCRQLCRGIIFYNPVSSRPPRQQQGLRSASHSGLRCWAEKGRREGRREGGTGREGGDSSLWQGSGMLLSVARPRREEAGKAGTTHTVPHMAAQL